MALIFKAYQTIEFIGDSITDFYRTSPEFSPLGSGYVRAIHTLLQAGYPELKLNMINKGISGDRITNLEARWQEDVLDINPDWLFIYIGVNDVWRKFEGDPDEAVALPDFSACYHRIIESARDNAKAQIRLISPFLAEADADDPFRKELALYQEAVDQIGNEYALPRDPPPTRLRLGNVIEALRVLDGRPGAPHRSGEYADRIDDFTYLRIQSVNGKISQKANTFDSSNSPA